MTERFEHLLLKELADRAAVVGGIVSLSIGHSRDVTSCRGSSDLEVNAGPWRSNIYVATTECVIDCSIRWNAGVSPLRGDIVASEGGEP